MAWMTLEVELLTASSGLIQLSEGNKYPGNICTGDMIISQAL